MDKTNNMKPDNELKFRLKKRRTRRKKPLYHQVINRKRNLLK